MMIVINGILQGTGDMKTLLYIITLANLLNLVGNYLIIFGVGPFPRLDVARAAVATALARPFMGILGLAALFHPRCLVRLSLRDNWQLNFPLIKDILIIGIPAAIEQSIIHGSQMLYTVLAAALGSIAVAANQLMMSAQSMTFFLVSAFRRWPPPWWARTWEPVS